MSAQFDVGALRQWTDEALSLVPYTMLDQGWVEVPRSLWNQLRADLLAAADEIERLQQLVKEEA